MGLALRWCSRVAEAGSTVERNPKVSSERAFGWREGELESQYAKSIEETPKDGVSLSTYRNRGVNRLIMGG